MEATFCGAEANVAVALSGLGHASRMVTILPDNRLGQAALAAMRAFNVDVSACSLTSGRMGLYFLSPGAMARPSEIIYDRAFSAFVEYAPQSYDWSALLGGADWLFVGGITAALGEGPLQALQKAMETARNSKIKIAFDCNYRPSLWQGREAQAKTVLRELSLQADLLLAGRRAIGMILDTSFDHADPDAGFQAAAQAVFQAAPHLMHVAATRRDVISSDRQRLTALLADRNGIAVSPTLSLDGIVDRIGTGDAFAAGIVHGLTNSKPLQDNAVFAAACSQWAHSVSGDFMRATLSDIEGLLAGGSGDVRR